MTKIILLKHLFTLVIKELNIIKAFIFPNRKLIYSSYYFI